MQERSNVIDFAAYRFARNLRLRQVAETEATHAIVWADAFRQPSPELSDAAAAHRARMLAHLGAAAPDRP